jgi:hypothetical protein
VNLDIYWKCTDQSQYIDNVKACLWTKWRILSLTRMQNRIRHIYKINSFIFWTVSWMRLGATLTQFVRDCLSDAHCFTTVTLAQTLCFLWLTFNCLLLSVSFRTESQILSYMLGRIVVNIDICECQPASLPNRLNQELEHYHNWVFICSG